MDARERLTTVSKGARRQLAPEVEKVMADVVAHAFRQKRVYSAAVWYSAVAEALKDTPHEPPSRNAFSLRFSAERHRRKAEVLERSARAAAQIGDHVGGQEVMLIPGKRPLGRRDYERVVASLTAIRSGCLSHAFNDYRDAVRRELPEVEWSVMSWLSYEEFRLIVFTPLFVEGVPHEAMPEWWTKKIGRLRAAESLMEKADAT